MKAFVIATLFVASCAASHYGAISTQFQAQDGHGGYSYGYSDPLSTKHETKSHDGTTHGGYSYVDAHGHVQSVKYVADPHNGFQIVHATNLPKGPVPVHVAAPVVHAYHAAPVAYGHHAYAPYAHGAPLPVQKTPEVIAAEHAHFAAVAEVKARQHHHHKRSAYGYAPAPVNGVPVDTPEVQHEKAQHFAAVQRALAGQPANPLVYQPQLAYNQYHAPAPVHSYKHVEPAPLPVNGVPVDTAEVAHLKAKHLSAVAEAKARASYGPSSYNHGPAPAYHHAPAAYHYPIINQHGVPEDTHEVKAEKAKHFALVAEAQSHSSHGPSYYGHDSSDDGSYDANKYENKYEQQYYH